MTDNLVYKSKSDTTVSCDDKCVGHFCDICLGWKWLVYIQMMWRYREWEDGNEDIGTAGVYIVQLGPTWTAGLAPRYK